MHPTSSVLPELIRSTAVNARGDDATRANASGTSSAAARGRSYSGGTSASKIPGSYVVGALPPLSYHGQSHDYNRFADVESGPLEIISATSDHHADHPYRQRSDSRASDATGDKRDSGFSVPRKPIGVYFDPRSVSRRVS